MLPVSAVSPGSPKLDADPVRLTMTGEPNSGELRSSRPGFVRGRGVGPETVSVLDSDVTTGEAVDEVSQVG